MLKTAQDIFEQDLTRYCSKWEQYFPIYDQWFSKFRGRNPTVVEVGVDCGGSLQLWKHYFGGNSRIVGLDNKFKFGEQDVGCQLCYVDQGNPIDWDNFILGFNSGIDVFIDDGSHMVDHQILTFEKIFPTMNEGGVYLCEDTHTNYWNASDGIGPEGPWNGGLKNYNTFIEYMKNEIDALHTDHLPNSTRWTADISNYISGLHFYDSVVVIEKRYRPKYQPVYANRERHYG